MASLALAAVAIGAAASLGARASAMAHQRDAARATVERLQRDARRDHSATIAARTQIDDTLATLTQTQQRLASAIHNEHNARASLQDALRLRDLARDQLAALSDQHARDTAATAHRLRALGAAIDAGDRQIAALDGALARRTLDHAAALVDLAEAHLALDRPTAAHDRAHAALLVLDVATPNGRSSQLVTRAQIAQLRAELDEPTLSAHDASARLARAAGLLDRVDAAWGPDSPERWCVASLVGQAALAADQADRAVAILTETLRVQLDGAGLASASTRLTQVRLAEALVAHGRPGEAAALVHLVLKAQRGTPATTIIVRAQAALDAAAVAIANDGSNPATRLAAQDSGEPPG